MSGVRNPEKLTKGQLALAWIVMAIIGIALPVGAVLAGGSGGETCGQSGSCVNAP